VTAFVTVGQDQDPERRGALLYHQRDAMDLKRFDCQADPFAETSDSRFLYFDALRRRIQEEVIIRVGRTAGFIVLTGKAGVGKTAMLQGLSEAIEARAGCYILSSVPWLTCRQEMSLGELAEAFSYARSVVRRGGAVSEAKLGAGLLGAGGQAGLGGGPRGAGIAAIILDDAHRLAPHVVAQLRRWRTAFQCVRGPLSIIATTSSEEGAADADATGMFLGNAASGDVLIRLRPFSRIDVQHFILHRLRTAGCDEALLFPPEAVTRIFAHAKGNPSETTRLCRRALALARKEGGLKDGGVSIAMIDAAARMEFRPPPTVAVDSPLVQPPFVPEAAVIQERLTGLPPASAMPEAAAASAIASSRSLSGREYCGFGVRMLGLASATAGTIVVLSSVGFYIFEQDRGVDPLATLKSALSSGISAAVALVQPAEPVEPALSPEAAPLPEASPPEAAVPVEARGDAGPDLSAMDQDEGFRQPPPAAPDPAASEAMAPMAADLEPLETKVEAASLVPRPEPRASGPLEPEAIEAKPLSPAALPLEAALPVTAPADVGPDLSVMDQGESHRQPPPAAPNPAAADPAAADMQLMDMQPMAAEPELLETEAVPGPAVPGLTVPGPDVNELLDRGNRLLDLGDVAAARLFYGMASDRGSAEAAMLMGITFDPVYFDGKRIYGTRPHVYEAIEWYRKSVTMGNVAAETNIITLEVWLLQAAQEGDEDARRALNLLFSPPPR
jgi:type II secretory pathway predicted ATPase ExeA